MIRKKESLNDIAEQIRDARKSINNIQESLKFPIYEEDALKLYMELKNLSAVADELEIDIIVFEKLIGNYRELIDIFYNAYSEDLDDDFIKMKETIISWTDDKDITFEYTKKLYKELRNFLLKKKLIKE